MEKLKAKHDHKLTDILKVMIFALFLILPGLIVLPSMLYYGVNEHATAPTEEVEIYEERQVNFNQLANPSNYQIRNTTNFSSSVSDYMYIINGTNLSGVKQDFALIPAGTIDINVNDIVYTSIYASNSLGNISYYAQFQGVNGAYPFLWTTYTVVDGYASFTGTSPVSSNKLEVWLRLQANNTETLVNATYIIKVVNLTQMFGAGNEPTANEFDVLYPNYYYDYTQSDLQIISIDTGETETYTDITSQIQYNWASLWKQPLFSWTNYTIVKQGIDNFTSVFGITNTSNISNLIAYELIIVAIYIVIDIVLTLFKWLTHLIGEK